MTSKACDETPLDGIERWGLAWVAGVEGDFSWTPLADQRGGAALDPNGALAGPNASVILSANTQWLASARAKLGFTDWFNNTMLYVTGGAGWANTEYTAVFITTPPLGRVVG